MKSLTVVAAGLGWNLLERTGKNRLAGFDFSPRKSVFPAVTCVAQASLRTGLAPGEHGVLCNGVWLDALRKPSFWEQSAKLVKGRRVWSGRREAGGTVGLFFFQQSLGEDADMLLSPAPIHKHGGGMVMSCYTKPRDLARAMESRFGSFPLWRYWGPLASAKVGRRCIDWFEAMTDAKDIDEAYLYLPTLDYSFQSDGPASPRALAALRELESQLERLRGICSRRGAALSVQGDYEITPVCALPASPNAILRANGFFRTRSVAGRAYPDFYSSGAFAVCDHEICILKGEERAKAAELLLSTGFFEEAPGGILLAQKGSWCDYRWWTDPREAPDFATHVDIHNKPGFDPRELFFFCKGDVKGTHGRQCLVACSPAQDVASAL